MIWREPGIVTTLSRRRDDAPLLDDGEAVAVEPDNRAVGVREENHLTHPEIEEDLRADAVVAQLGNRRAAVLDQSAQAVEQAGRQWLAQQDDDAAAEPRDHLHRALQHPATAA